MKHIILLTLTVFLFSCSSELKEELAKKNKEIEKLQVELESKNSQISMLQKSKEDRNEAKADTPNKKSELLLDLLLDERFRDSEVEIKEIDSISIIPLVAYRMTIRNKNDTNAGYQGYQGSGILITNPQLQFNKVVWSNMDLMSDFPPHTFYFIDFNGDGEKDLICFSGFEDVFTTELFLNQSKTENKKVFKPVFFSDNSYSSIFDFDKDGIPEILNVLDELEWSPTPGYTIPKSTEALIQEEYDNIIGGYDEYTFRYGMPDVYKEFAIDLMAKVEILRLSGDSMINVSSEFPNHFDFRLKALNSLEIDSEDVKPWIEKLKETATKYSQK
ncbi:MAG: VCBS repeat-containing protein [Cytophagia bacterium]|nr:VCBS repeat-containing protein [Cytophagia bacterium]